MFGLTTKKKTPATLPALFNACRDLPEVAAIAETREAHKRLSGVVERLTLTIEEKAAQIERAAPSRSAAVEGERENLLAAIAMGERTPEELEAFDRENAKAREEAQRDAAQRARTQSDLAATVEGLNRRLAAARAELATVSATLSEQQCAAVMAISAALASAYADKISGEVAPLFGALRILSGYAHQMGGGDFCLSIYGTPRLFPAVEVEDCAQRVQVAAQSTVPSEQSVQEVSGHLTALGVL